MPLYKKNKEELLNIKNNYPDIWDVIKHICPRKFGYFCGFLACFCFCNENNMKKCWEETLK